MKLVSDRIRDIKSSLPIIQNELNVKQPQVKLEVGSGLIPIQAISAFGKPNRQIAKILLATKAQTHRQPARASIKGKEHKSKSSQVALIAADIAEATLKSILKHE